jgi:disulfide bond formation protein DsbB
LPIEPAPDSRTRERRHAGFIAGTNPLLATTASAMTTATLSTFFALLALVCAAATIATIALAIVAKRQGTTSAANGLLTSVSDAALWMAWLVALVTTLGSLYYSLVAHYLPCELCWYQRICVYPLAAVLLVAAWRRDRAVWRYAVPLAAVGAGFAAYHTQLQAFPKQKTFCNLYNPCTIRYVWEFGFMSMPLMALIAFCFVITMVVVAR